MIRVARQRVIKVSGSAGRRPQPGGVFRGGEDRAGAEGSGDNISPRTIEVPYQYMSPEVKAQFLALRQNMSEYDDRITFHNRSDGMWSTIYDQPALIYNGSSLNED